jgi:hypothetical protein
LLRGGFAGLQGRGWGNGLVGCFGGCWWDQVAYV